MRTRTVGPRRAGSLRVVAKAHRAQLSPGLSVLGLVAAIVVGGFVALARILRKDEAIDAATSLALRELRERFERGPK